MDTDSKGKLMALLQAVSNGDHGTLGLLTQHPKKSKLDVDAKGNKKGIPEEVSDQKPLVTDENSLEAAEKIEYGQKSKVKEQYEGKKTCDCCITWVDQKPLSENNPKSLKNKEERDKSAIIHRKWLHGGTTSWKTYSVVVNSPHLKPILGEILKDYPSIDMSSPELEIKAPFHPLLHRWKRFQDFDIQNLNQKGKEHFNLLSDLVGPEVEKGLQSMNHFNESGSLGFEQIPLAFIPGEIVLRSYKDVFSAGILQEVNREMDEANKSYFQLEVYTIDWDGYRCGAVKQHWEIQQYKGSRKLVNEAIFPLRIREDREEIEKDLIARGKIFETLRRRVVKNFNGRITTHVRRGLWGHPSENEKIVNERVVIDAASYFNIGDLNAPMIVSFSDVPCLAEESTRAKQNMNSNVQGEAEAISPLTYRQLLITPARVRGFAFECKTWCEIEICGLSDIFWNENAIKDLVLGEDEKSLLLAISAPSNSRQSKPSISDSKISGKGQGSVILLYGPPGVGKTLTAESLAECQKCPLYKLGATDLGNITYEVEKKVQNAFKLCELWNAILLIDEADVFLEARSLNSLKRNEIVSLFLRLLEYYQGIVILTTNRIQSIDEAFESRIDLTLAYDELSFNSRLEVWNNSLAKLSSGSIDLSLDAITGLARMPLNGRQIQSSIKTAQLLAAHKQESLQLSHIEVVINLRSKSCHLMKKGAL